MNFLLDSSACIAMLRAAKRPTATESSGIRVRGTMDKHDAEGRESFVCSVVRMELLAGALRSAQPKVNENHALTFLSAFRSIPFDDRAADKAAEIRVALAHAGTPIGPNDLLIAAIALASGLTLVTHNTAEFARVPGLSIEDWEAAV